MNDSCRPRDLCRCYTRRMFDSHFIVVFCWLSRKNRSVRDPSDGMSEEVYHYPFFWFVFIDKISSYHHKPAFLQRNDKVPVCYSKTPKQNGLTYFNKLLHFRIEYNNNQKLFFCLLKIIPLGSGSVLKR